jgi:predicted alpha/beta superfamily hydrolase
MKQKPSRAYLGKRSTNRLLLPPDIDPRDMRLRHLSLQGSFHLYRNVTSQYLDEARSLMLYLPPGYTRERTRRYPVLYTHDGNNLFDPATGFMGREWRLDETLDRLIENGQLHPLIVVGIANTRARMEEYTWYPGEHHGHVSGGLGPAYARFVAEELKPWIDAHYRTLPDRECTGLMGSSLGALISFYIARAYPEKFSRVAMLSPTVYWADHGILADTATFPDNMRLWVDIGTEEGRDPDTEETVESTLRFVDALSQHGYSTYHNLGFYIDPEAGHDEWAWANRVELPLRFLFGK